MADIVKEEKVEEVQLPGLIDTTPVTIFLIGIIYIQNGVLSNL